MPEEKKSPAFQFYAAEFLADENVVLMSNQQVGCYIKLMAYCWREGSIPAEIDKIAKLCGEDDSAMSELWLGISGCFESAIDSPNRLQHPRLVKELEKQKSFKEERAQSGKKGAEARWGKGKKAYGSSNGSAKNKPMAKNGSSSSSSSSVNSPSESNKTCTQKFDPQAYLDSLGVDVTVARDWLTLRKSKRAAPTETAIKGIANEARKAGVSLQAALKTACERGWQGFKADWLMNAQPPPRNFQDANAQTIAALTGRSLSHEPDERTIDV